MGGIREEMLKIATPCFDSEWHGEGYPTMAEVLVDQLMDYLKSKGVVRLENHQSLPQSFRGGTWASDNLLYDITFYKDMAAYQGKLHWRI